MATVISQYNYARRRAEMGGPWRPWEPALWLEYLIPAACVADCLGLFPLASQARTRWSSSPLDYAYAIRDAVLRECPVNPEDHPVVQAIHAFHDLSTDIVENRMAVAHLFVTPAWRDLYDPPKSTTP